MKLTTKQRDALDTLNRAGYVYSDRYSHRGHNAAHPSTLESLVKHGHAEWSDEGHVWSRIVKPGANAERKAREQAAVEKAARARADLIARLAANPAELAEYVVSLGETLSLRIAKNEARR
jgi:hypothetical protein